MRWLQAFLLILGSAALGTTLGFFGLAVVAASMQRPGGEPWQAGYGQYMAGLFCGAPVGAMIGFASGLARVCSRHQAGIWSRLVWAGVALGVAAGAFLSFRFGVHRGMGWWGTAVASLGFATLGGILAGLVAEARRPDGRSR
ncbi:hypothetical protein [Paludisphaera soli]|uniref:hypothetical protein n=1 Tax=Paludisphaera soli TaxID=2712865 RepID=UPI0013EC21E2|nr:hypothetical protein [Paludisphaera soli]